MAADLNILVGIHFDVVERRIGQRCEGREDAGQALRSDASRMDVGHIHAPLLPPHRHQVRADEGQQALTRALPALAKQHVGLVDAVNGSVARNLGANDIGEGREEIHDREHGIRGCIRLDLARPADETTCSDRAFGCFAQLATKWTRIAHVRRPLISQIPDDLTFRPVVRGEDEKRVVVDLEVFQRLEDPADVVVAFHHPVTILANPRLPRELLRREVRKMPHGEWQVEEERLARLGLSLHKVDGLPREFKVDLAPNFHRVRFELAQRTISNGLVEMRPLFTKLAERLVGRVRERCRAGESRTVPREVGRKAVELVESVGRRQALRSDAQVPFAIDGRRIAGVLEQLPHRERLARERVRGTGQDDQRQAVADGVLPGHQRRPRRCAGGLDQKLCKA